MKRPNKWRDLPWPIWEYLFDAVELDYCTYEGSRAEAVESLIYGAASHINEARVAEYYSGVDNETFISWVDKAIGRLEEGSAQLLKLMEGKL